MTLKFPVHRFAVAGAFGALLAACSQSTYPSHAAVIVDSAEVDLASFWPPHPRYLAASDTFVAELSGLQRGFVCGEVLACELQARVSGSDSTVLQSYAKIEYPGTPACGLDTGLDTALRVTAPTSSRLYLNNSSGARTDSALIVSATVRAESLLYVPADSGSVASGTFTFHAASLVLNAASLPACEVLQSAVYRQSGDTLRVRFHLLDFDSTTSQLALPPCAGAHADSVSVAADRFALPSP